MHYKNGREAKNGDTILMMDGYNKPVVGILYNAIPGNDTCNGRVAITTPTDPTPCLNQCLHIDDVMVALVDRSTAETASE